MLNANKIEMAGVTRPTRARGDARSALECQAWRHFRIKPMKLKVIVHEAEEGGYWAEVPAIPGCVTQAESHDELLKNLQEAIVGCLSVLTHA